MSQWTETIEKNLIAMQQNAKKLAENYLERYTLFKNVTTYLNVPLLLLSALNAYVIYDADSYSRGVQIGSSATSLGIAIILSGEFLYMFRNTVEQHFLKYKQYETMEQSIRQTLTIDRLHRIMEADTYFEETFRQYKTLVADDMFIMKYLGNLGIPEEITTEDIHDILHDHWNILFRPTFRRIKQKNQKVIEALKSTGQRFDLEGFVSPDLLSLDILEEEVKKTPFWSWLPAMWKKKDDLAESPISSTPTPTPTPNLTIPDSIPPVPPVEIEKQADADVESCGSSFCKGSKEDIEDTKSNVLVEMSNVYPESTQKVIYEPLKRPAFAMSFSDKL